MNKKKINKQIDEALGIDGNDFEGGVYDEVVVESDTIENNEIGDGSFEEDFSFIRTKLRRSILVGEALLIETFKEISLGGRSPRTLEVAQQIVKCIADNSLSLLSLHEKTKKIKPPKIEETEQEQGEQDKLTASLNDIISEIE